MHVADMFELDVKNPLRVLPSGDDVRHIVYGLVLYLMLCMLPRQGIGARGPLLGLLAVELLNEWADRLHYGSWRLADTIGDVWHTMLLPLLLTMIVREIGPHGLRSRPA